MIAITVFKALIPIFAVITAGFFFRRHHFPTQDFWPAAEKITYFFLFPALLFHATATAQITFSTTTPLFQTLATAILLLSVATVFFRPFFGVPTLSFSSLFQGAIRFNTYVGFAIVTALFGADTLPLASLTIAFLIPLVNLLSVIACVHNNAATQKSFLQMAAIVAKTPPFLACTLGFLFSVLNIPVPEVLLETLRLCGRASLPLGLLAVGAGLVPRSLIRSLRPIIMVVTLKLVCLPIVMFFTARFFGLPSATTAVAVLFAALPGSSSSYILARQLGGDSELMAAIVSAQIIFSPLTLPFFLAFMLQT